jgi:LmbE family N-acetylglucosaminyl deacetylase
MKKDNRYRAPGGLQVTIEADVLVISPHPDDAEYGVAGTVARWTREGKQVVYIICTNGDKGTSDADMKPQDLVEIRKKEQLAAADVLGVSEVIFLGLPDQGLEETPKFRKQIVRLIRQYRPQIVVTADPYRRYIWHRDHRIAGQVVLDAVFPYARDHLAYPDLLEEGLLPIPLNRSSRHCAATTARCRPSKSPTRKAGSGSAARTSPKMMISS